MDDKPKKDTTRNKLVSDEKSEARELWFKTVVKVLRWKEGNKGKSQPQVTETITVKEWDAYCKETLKINANVSKPKTVKKLQDIEELIRKNGGFA